MVVWIYCKAIDVIYSISVIMVLTKQNIESFKMYLKTSNVSRNKRKCILLVVIFLPTYLINLIHFLVVILQ